jgi:hypothetical protein
MDEIAALAGLEGIGRPLGEPAAVWAVARGFVAAADTLDRSAKRVAATIAMLERQRGWSGRASGAFLTRCREYQHQLTTAAETFREVVIALNAYAARLEVAQTMVDDARRSVLLSVGSAAVIPLPDLNWALRRADMAISEVRAASLVAATELRALANRATPVPGPVRRPRPGAARHSAGGLGRATGQRAPPGGSPPAREGGGDPCPSRSGPGPGAAAAAGAGGADRPR